MSNAASIFLAVRRSDIFIQEWQFVNEGKTCL